MDTSRILYVAQKKQAVPWEVPIPKLGSTQVLVEVKTTAVNPIDVIQVEMQWADGCGVGCDFSGIVLETGEEVTSVRKGDTVFGAIGGSNVDAKMDGAFSNLIRVEAEVLLKPPVQLSTDLARHIPSGPITTFEQAASVGLSLGTVYVSMVGQNSIDVKKDTNKGYAVVYSAASSLGFMVVQVAKYIGFEVIALASERNFALLRSVGVKHLIDYHDENWEAQVREIGGDNISFAYDCFSSPESVVKVYTTITTKGPAYVNYSQAMMSDQIRIQNIKPNIKLCAPNWFQLVQDVKKFGPIAIDVDQKVIDARGAIFAAMQNVISQGFLKALPITVVGAGLKHIPEAMFAVRKGVVATKIAVRVESEL